MIEKFLYNIVSQQKDRCNICFSSHIRQEHMVYQHEVVPPAYVRKKLMHFLICEDCGYSFCGENFKDYIRLGAQSISSSRNYTRVGDGTNQGREFFMAQGAIEILRKSDFFMTITKINSLEKKDLRILIFAPGNSLDHNLLRQLDSVAECKITDLVNFQNSEYFVPIDTNETFDIVIACEVVEHFVEPKKEFSNLFRYLNKDGLLVISTDIRQDVNFSGKIYPFLYGHTSYYSGRSLLFLAQMNQLFIDFRTPTGKNFRTKTKKYIYMTKSKETHKNIINYFSIKTLPDCE